MNREVPIRESRTAANSALSSVVELAQRRVLKIIRIEPVSRRRKSERRISFPGVQLLKRRNQTGGLGAQEEEAIDELGIVLGIQANGKTALELGDAGERPIIQKLSGKA